MSPTIPKLLLVTLAILAFLHIIRGETTNGALQLNAGVLHKMMSKFKVALIKFDESAPIGRKQETFARVARVAIGNDDFLVAEIRITEVHDMENMDLGKLFDVNMESYPAYKLFLNTQDLNTSVIDLNNRGATAQDIKRWIAKYTDIWIGPPECIEEFENLMVDFHNATTMKMKEDIRAHAQLRANGLESHDRRWRAQMYVDAFKGIMEQGVNYIPQELAIVKNKVKEFPPTYTLLDLKVRAIILGSFRKFYRSKDEL